MRLSLVSVAVLLASSSVTVADVVQMPAAGTETETAPAASPAMQMDMPVRGMHARDVESGYGAPLEKIPPVGEPPISRWVYPDYTVYFEHQYVIHTVPKHR